MLLPVATLVSGCAADSAFRNRDYDYALDKVYANKALKIPKSVSANPDIQPRFILPNDATQAFASNQSDHAYASLTPPGFNKSYDTDLLLQRQMMVVKTRLTYDDDNQAHLVIDEPFKLSWNLVDEALKQLDGYRLVRVDEGRNAFVVEDMKNSQQYYVYVAEVKTNFRQTQVSVFDMNENPVSSLAANALIENLNKKIQGRKLSDKDLIESSYGFVVTDSGLKYQYYDDAKVAAIVLVPVEGDKIDEIIKKAVKGAGFSLIGEDKKAQTITIEDAKKNHYQLYIYDYTQMGSIFSDWSNWHSFFRAEQKQVRVSVFDMDSVLLPPEQAKPILMKIEEALPQAGA